MVSYLVGYELTALTYSDGDRDSKGATQALGGIAVGVMPAALCDQDWDGSPAVQYTAWASEAC